MKRAVGFDFTEGFVKNLKSRGFTCFALTESVTDGFQSYFFPLKDPQGEFDGFEIHVIYEEEKYLSAMKLECFHPFIKTVNPNLTEATHLNTVESFQAIVSPDDLVSSELRTFLQLRKNFPVAALELRCRNLSEFSQIATPQLLFKVRGENAALIHLGPSCFDLLITEAKPTLEL